MMKLYVFFFKYCSLLCYQLVNFFSSFVNVNKNYQCSVIIRAVPRIFCLGGGGGQTPHTHPQGSPVYRQGFYSGRFLFTPT